MSGLGETTLELHALPCDRCGEALEFLPFAQVFACSTCRRLVGATVEHAQSGFGRRWRRPYSDLDAVVAAEGSARGHRAALVALAQRLALAEADDLLLEAFVVSSNAFALAPLPMHEVEQILLDAVATCRGPAAA